MKKNTIPFVMFLLIIPISYACRTPIIYNEYGVPVNPFGGMISINGGLYPEDQKMVLFNVSLNNTDDQEITLTLTPSSNLWNYVYEGTTSIPANSIGNLTLRVWVDGMQQTGPSSITFLMESLYCVTRAWGIHV